MNYLFLALSVFALALPASAGDSKPVVSCMNADFYQPGEDGKPVFQPSGMSIVVSPLAQTEYGYTAVISGRGQTYENPDTQVQTVTADKSGEIKGLSTALLSDLNWENVAFVRTANVGVKANRDDAAGIKIFELLDKNQAILGAVATIGWGFARCN